MKNFHKVRRKREFLFDDKELFILGGGAIIICILIFILGAMVGQTLQEQSVASPLVAGDEFAGDEGETAESEMSQSDTLLAENRSQEDSATIPSSEKKSQRGYYTVLPDSGTYVEVEATPVKKSSSEPAPATKSEQSAQKKKTPKQVIKEETPVPPATSPVAAPLPRENVASVPVLPNVPKDPSDEIRLGRQSRNPEIAAPLSGMIYSIQVASSTSREASERLQQKYGQLGYLAYIMTADLGEKGIWYRVRVGNLKTPEEAKLLKKEILEKAPKLANDPYVIKVTE